MWAWVMCWHLSREIAQARTQYAIYYVLLTINYEASIRVRVYLIAFIYAWCVGYTVYVHKVVSCGARLRVGVYAQG